MVYLPGFYYVFTLDFTLLYCPHEEIPQSRMSSLLQLCCQIFFQFIDCTYLCYFVFKIDTLPAKCFEGIKFN